MDCSFITLPTLHLLYRLMAAMMVLSNTPLQRAKIYECSKNNRESNKTLLKHIASL